jgi:hypothetical protein
MGRPRDRTQLQLQREFCCKFQCKTSVRCRISRVGGRHGRHGRIAGRRLGDGELLSLSIRPILTGVLVVFLPGRYLARPAALVPVVAAALSGDPSQVREAAQVGRLSQSGLLLPQAGPV